MNELVLKIIDLELLDVLTHTGSQEAVRHLIVGGVKVSPRNRPMTVALQKAVSVPTAKRRRLVSLGTDSYSRRRAGCMEAGRAMSAGMTEEVVVVCVQLVPRQLGQHRCGGHQLRHEEEMVRKVTMEMGVTCGEGPAHMSKSRSFSVWDLCTG